MIIEFFGLSNSGKSAFKKKLDKKGLRTFQQQELSFFQKICLFMRYFLFHPLSTLYLFIKLNSNRISNIPLSINKRFKIWRLRNFYLAFVLAKYELFKKENTRIFTDEFSFQSLFMIFHKRTDKQEILNVLKKLPKSDIIFLFEGQTHLRYRAYKKKHPLYPGATLLPGSRIDKNFANEWMKIMEYNFRIVKEIILEKYKIKKDLLKELKFNYPKIYYKSQ